MSIKNKDITITLTEQGMNGMPGRWYGRIVGINECNGNEIDACLDSRQKTINCLLEQLREIENNGG